MAFVEPPAFLAGLKEVPDVLDVVVGMCVVAIVPAHPLAEPDRLLRNNVGEFLNSSATLPGKLGQPVGFNLTLGVEAQLFLYFDLDPEALAIEAILPALIESPHGMISLEDVLVGPSPGVVHAHGVVGRNRTIDEREYGVAAQLLLELLERPNLIPEFKDLVLESREIDAARYRLVHRFSVPQSPTQKWHGRGAVPFDEGSVELKDANTRFGGPSSSFRRTLSMFTEI